MIHLLKETLRIEIQRAKSDMLKQKHLITKAKISLELGNQATMEAALNDLIATRN